MTGTVLSRRGPRSAISVIDRALRASPRACARSTRRTAPAEIGHGRASAARSTSPAGIDQGRDPARRLGARSGAAHAPTDRDRRAAALLAARGEAARANGCRCICIIGAAMAPARIVLLERRADRARRGRAGAARARPPDRRAARRPLRRSAMQRPSARSAAAWSSTRRRPRAESPHAGAARAARCARDRDARRQPPRRAARVAPVRRRPRGLRVRAEPDRRTRRRAIRCRADGARHRGYRASPRSAGSTLRAAVLAERSSAFHSASPELPGMRARTAAAQSMPPRLPAAGLRAVARGAARAPGRSSLDGAWLRAAAHRGATPARGRDALGARRADARRRPALPAAARARHRAAQLGAAEAEVRALMKRLARMGRVDEVAHDHFFRDADGRRDGRDRRTPRPGASADGASPPRSSATARQRPQGRDPDPRVLRPPRRHLARGDLRRIHATGSDLFRPARAAPRMQRGRETSPVGRPDFKSGRGREPVLGGFDSHSLPPIPLRRMLSGPMTSRCDLVLVGGGHAHVQVLRPFGMQPLPGVRLDPGRPRGRDALFRHAARLSSPGTTRSPNAMSTWRRCARFAGARLIHGRGRSDSTATAARCCSRGRPGCRFDLVSLDVGATPSLSVPGAADPRSR